MNDDDRLAQYLADRARAIPLAPRDASAVAARAERRRRKHRLTGAVAAATVVIVGAVVVFTGGAPKQSVNVGATPGANRTDLEWTSVDVPDGLGWSSTTVSAADGSIYGLSTAPGPIEPDEQVPTPSVLYRSTDGRSWSEATLPDGFSPSALASSADHLYAVGTAPAGGNGIDLVIASSTDGAQHWSRATIPTPRADLKERFPTEVVIDAPVIAVGPTGLLAGVNVRAFPDVARLLAEIGIPSPQGYRMTPAGIDVYAPIDPSSCTPQSPTTTPSDATEASVPPCAAAKERADEPAIERSYTWEEIGLDPELQQLVAGELHLYASADGSAFDEVAAPVTGGGYFSAIVGGDDGYRLLTSSATPGIHQQFSADGRSWTSTGPGIDGWLQASGSLAGAPAALIGTTSGATLLTAAPGGGWDSLDLLAAVGVTSSADQPAGLQAAAFGPLGLVAVVTSDGTGANTTVVDSADGRRFTTHSIAELAGEGDWSVAGISMNADAAIVRLLPTAKPEPSDPPGPQRLLVGTTT